MAAVDDVRRRVTTERSSAFLVSRRLCAKAAARSRRVLITGSHFLLICHYLLVSVQRCLVRTLVTKNNTVSYQCPSGLCLNGNASSPNMCAGLRQGPLCAGCPPSHTPIGAGALCVQCDGIDWSILTGLFGLLIVMLLYLHVSALGSSSKLKITFYFVQIGTLISPTALGSVLAFVNFRLAPGSTAIFG
jgi:hypothetical protein